MKLTSQVTTSGTLADLAESEIARVGVLMQNNAIIRAQFPIDLSGAGIHRVGPQRPMLQKAIDEAAGGSSHVEADAPGNRDIKVLERSFEFDAASADITHRLLYRDAILCRDCPAGLVGPLPVYQNFAGQNQSLCFLARIGELAFDQRKIETKL